MKVRENLTPVLSESVSLRSLLLSARRAAVEDTPLIALSLARNGNNSAKLVALNFTNLGLFKISFQYILAAPKCTEN